MEGRRPHIEALRAREHDSDPNLRAHCRVCNEKFTGNITVLKKEMGEHMVAAHG